MQILVVPKKEYNPSFSRKQLLKMIDTHGLYMERGPVETNFDYLQIIPYIIVKQDKNLFLYSRLKKGGESRLHNKLSIGVGGHVDYVERDNMSNSQAIIVNAYKELDEELDIELTSEFLDITFLDKTIYDDTNDVGKVHLGILMSVDASNRSVSVKETEKLEGKFYSIDEIKNLHQEREDAFETWTTIALKYLQII